MESLELEIAARNACKEITMHFVETEAVNIRKHDDAKHHADKLTKKIESTSMLTNKLVR